MEFKFVEDPQEELKQIIANGKAQGLTYDEIMPDPELAFLDFHLKITGKWEEFFPAIPSLFNKLDRYEQTQFFEDTPYPSCVHLRLYQGSIYGIFSVKKDRWWQYVRFWKGISDNTTIEVRPRPANHDLYNLRIQNPYKVLESLTRDYGFIQKIKQVFHDIQKRGVNNSR